MELQRVVTMVLDEYDGSFANVNNPDDMKLCQRAEYFFNLMPVDAFDFGPKGQKYGINTNQRKVLCREEGFKADKDRLAPDSTHARNNFVTRHDSVTFSKGKI